MGEVVTVCVCDGVAPLLGDSVEVPVKDPVADCDCV